MKYIYKYVKLSKELIRHHPEEMIVAILLSVVLMVVAVVFSFYLMFKPNTYYGELPDVVPTKNSTTTSAPSGWKLLNKTAMGPDVCYLYQKGLSYKVKCFGKNNKNKWYLKNVF